jgi:hypothetical protein
MVESFFLTKPSLPEWVLVFAQRESTREQQITYDFSKRFVATFKSRKFMFRSLLTAIYPRQLTLTQTNQLTGGQISSFPYSATMNVCRAIPLTLVIHESTHLLIHLSTHNLFNLPIKHVHNRSILEKVSAVCRRLDFVSGLSF